MQASLGATRFRHRLRIASDAARPSSMGAWHPVCTCSKSGGRTLCAAAAAAVGTVPGSLAQVSRGEHIECCSLRMAQAWQSSCFQRSLGQRMPCLTTCEDTRRFVVRSDLHDKLCISSTLHYLVACLALHCSLPPRLTQMASHAKPSSHPRDLPTTPTTSPLPQTPQNHPKLKVKLSKPQRPISWHKWERSYLALLLQQQQNLAVLSGEGSDEWYYSVGAF